MYSLVHHDGEQLSPTEKAVATVRSTEHWPYKHAATTSVGHQAANPFALRLGKTSAVQKNTKNKERSETSLPETHGASLPSPSSKLTVAAARRPAETLHVRIHAYHQRSRQASISWCKSAHKQRIYRSGPRVLPQLVASTAAACLSHETIINSL